MLGIFRHIKQQETKSSSDKLQRSDDDDADASIWASIGGVLHPQQSSSSSSSSRKSTSNSVFIGAPVSQTSVVANVVAQAQEAPSGLVLQPALLTHLPREKNDIVLNLIKHIQNLPDDNASTPMQKSFVLNYIRQGGRSADAFIVVAWLLLQSVLRHVEGTASNTAEWDKLYNVVLKYSHRRQHRAHFHDRRPLPGDAEHLTQERIGTSPFNTISDDTWDDIMDLIREAQTKEFWWMYEDRMEDVAGTF